MTQFKTPISHSKAVAWGSARQTHPAVAMAIHAIAGKNRPADAIWEAPTMGEWSQVSVAVEDYIRAGIFEAEDSGRYPWGKEVAIIS